MRVLSERFQRMYDRVKEDNMKRNGFSEEEMSKHYLDNPAFKVTKSARIWRLITLAYCLGHLRGIAYVDEMTNTKITLR